MQKINNNDNIIQIIIVVVVANTNCVYMSHILIGSKHVLFYLVVSTNQFNGMGEWKNGLMNNIGRKKGDLYSRIANLHCT